MHISFQILIRVQEDDAHLFKCYTKSYSYVFICRSSSQIITFLNSSASRQQAILIITIDKIFKHDPELLRACTVTESICITYWSVE